MTLNDIAVWMDEQDLLDYEQDVHQTQAADDNVGMDHEHTVYQRWETRASGKTTPLHLAVLVRETGFRRMRVLLDAGMDVNARNCVGQTPLHLVVGHAPDSVLLRARTLLEYGADPNAKDNTGSTPLSNLMGHERNAALESLIFMFLSHGADPNARLDGADRNTLLHWAVEKGNVQLITACIHNGADVNRKNADGKTPLHIAVGNYFCGLSIMETLLDLGEADPCVMDNMGMTPLMTICSLDYCFVDRIDMLLRYVEKPKTILYINARDEAGCNALMHAAKKPFGTRNVLHLLSIGADPMQQDSHGSNVLSHISKHAHSKNAVEAVRQLLHAGVDPNSSDRLGKTPLHFAAEATSTTFLLLEILLHSSANPSKCDKAGNIPLYYACLQNDPNKVYTLVREMVGLGCIFCPS